ncbi:MAG: hypothetical protein PHT19_14655, partial [Methylococcus sp.]|nr:hypothetical protein [Methylococcus sp.]
LVELAARLDCALLGISHFSKGTAGRDPLERVTGSLAFGALARIVFAAFKQSEEDGGGRCFCRVKSNIGPDDGGFQYDLTIEDLAGHPGVTASHVAWGEAVEGSARALLARAEASGNPDEVSALEEACGFLAGLLAEGPVAAKEVQRQAQEATIAWATVRRAKTKLEILAAKEGMDGGWVWKL